MEITESEKVQYGILAILWIEFLWELYLAIRQHKLCKNTTDVPNELQRVISQQTFDRARLYSLDKSSFSIVKDFFSIILSTVVIHFGFFYKFWALAIYLSPWNNEISHSCIWLLILNTISTIIGLPFSIYHTFILEDRYGFNKQTAYFFIKDKLKSFILAQALTVPISAFSVFIVQVGGTYFFLWLWLMIGIVTLILLTIYPAYIAPLFDTYSPLPEGELRTAIENLASDLKFPLSQIYVVDGSKRSAHSNAYFYGLFKMKRIVLFDTLFAKDGIGGCQNDEILAVLSHELGHWHHNHMNKNIIIMELNLFFMFNAFALMFKYTPLYTSLGFPTNITPILVGLISVIQFILAPYNTIVSFLTTVLSRHFEFQADAFAVSLDKAGALQSALINLHNDNLAFPVYDKLYSCWHLSHPPLIERINAMKKSQ